MTNLLSSLIIKRRSSVRTLLKGAIAISIVGLFVLASCGKDELSIGRENPDLEIQKCVRLSAKKKFEQAIECLQIFKSKFPKSQYGIDAELKIADNYFDQREFELAADTYMAFTRLYPYDPKLDYAFYRAGLSYYNTTPKSIARDQEYLDDAADLFRMVMQNFPGSAYFNLAAASLRDAQEKIARRNFYVGRFYYRTGEFIAAAPRFLTVLDEYPHTTILERSLYFLTKVDIKLGNLEEAKKAYSELVTRFPKSKYSKKLEHKLIAAAEKAQKKTEE